MNKHIIVKASQHNRKHFIIKASCNDVNSATVEELQKGMTKFTQQQEKVGKQLDGLKNRALKRLGKRSTVTSANVDDYEYDIQEISQEFTSENTSINSKRLPAIFNMVDFEPGTINIDYGGGKFDNVAEYLTQYDVINLVYDPYNRSKEHNQEVIRTIRSAGGADTATCSNVLNVIKEPEVRLNVLNNMKKLVKPGGKIYITVYEGSGKGNEGPTKSGYQLNRKTADYLEEIQEVFPDCTRKGKLIQAINASTSIKGTRDINRNLTIDEAYKIAIRNISDSYGSVSSSILKPSSNTPFYRFYINQYDVGEYIVYENNGIIYVEDSDTHQVNNKYTNPKKFMSFIQRINDGGSQMKDSNYNVNSAERMKTKNKINAARKINTYTDYVEFDFDCDIYINPNGSWDFMSTDDLDFLDGPGTFGDWYSDEYDVRIASPEDVLDDFITLLEVTKLPQPNERTNYHISGSAMLAYSISGIREQYDDLDSDYSYDIEDANSTFNISDSSIIDWSCTEY